VYAHVAGGSNDGSMIGASADSDDVWLYKSVWIAAKGYSMRF
jgi:hypothetical protein